MPKPLEKRFPRYQALLFAILSTFSMGTSLFAEGPLTIAEVKRETPVDFEKDILPMLRQNCLACHNHTDAESDLVLETPQLILKGGSSGAALVVGKGTESLLLKVSAHQTDSPMPPIDNKIGAKSLTPEQLGLLKLWIDEGAKGSVVVAKTIQWQPLPAGVNPIYAVAVSPDGQYAAAGRANQIFIYHLGSKREIGRLTDPALTEGGHPGVAHRDLVQSLRFSPDGEFLASGGFRTVKLWQRPKNIRRLDLEKQEQPLSSIKVNAAGTIAAVADAAGRVALVELPSGSRLRTLEGHEGPVQSLAFSPSQSKLVTGGSDKLIRVWNVADGQLLSKIESPVPVQAVTFIGDGTQIASAGTDNMIRLWVAADGSAAKELAGHTGPVTSLAVSSDATRLLSGSLDGTMRWWDIANGSVVRQFDQGGPVNSVAVRADGQRFASAGANLATKLWDAEGKQIAELKGDFHAKIQVEKSTREVTIAKREVDANKGELKTATERKTAEEKNAVATEETLKKATAEHVSKVEATKKPMADKLAADELLTQLQTTQAKQEAEKKSAAENLALVEQSIKKAQADLVIADTMIAESAAAASQVEGLFAESLAKAQAAAKAEVANQALKSMVEAVESAVKSAKDNQKAAAEAKKVDILKRIAEEEAKKKTAEEQMKTLEAALAKTQADTKGATDNLTKLTEALKKATDAENVALVAMQSAERAVQRAKEAVQLATSAIGPVEMAIAAAEANVKQMEENLKQATKAATEFEKAHTLVGFTGNSQVVVTTDDSSWVRTWDANSGASLETYQGHAAKVTAIDCLPNGDLLSGATDGNAILWDCQPEWKLVRSIGSEDTTSPLADRVTALDFSPDSKSLATGSGEPSRTGELKLWNVSDGSLVREIADPHSDMIYGLEFSPDGKLIASSAADRTAKVFDTATGKFVRTFEGHSHHVLGVSWRADGRVLATSGADNVVKVWDVKSGEQKRTIAGFGKEVTSIRFLAEGSQILASCGDQTVQVKNTDDGANIRGLSGPADFMHSVAASGNGKRIAAGGQDSVLRIWEDNGNVLAIFAPPK